MIPDSCRGGPELPEFVKKILEDSEKDVTDESRDNTLKDVDYPALCNQLATSVRSRKTVEKDKEAFNLGKLDKRLKKLAIEIRWRQLHTPPAAVGSEQNLPGAVRCCTDGFADEVPRQGPMTGQRYTSWPQGKTAGARQLHAVKKQHMLACQRTDTQAAMQSAAGGSQAGPVPGKGKRGSCDKQVPADCDGIRMCGSCPQKQAAALNAHSAPHGRVEAHRPNELSKLRSAAPAAGVAAAAAGPSGLKVLPSNAFYGSGGLDLRPQIVNAANVRHNVAPQPRAAPSHAGKSKQQQQASGAVLKRAVLDAADEEHAPTTRRGSAGAKQRGRRSAPTQPEPEDKEPIDLADTSDEEGEPNADGDLRVNSGSAAGPGPSSAAAAAPGLTGDVGAVRPGSFRSLSVQLAGLKCYYPPEGGKHSVEVNGEDLARLEKGEFLNDTCIDFYIKYIEYQLSQDKQSRYHFFNSFFLKKLQEKTSKPVKLKADRTRLDHERVKKWTKHVDLFSKDYIFVPIHGYLHWSLVLICHPGNVIQQQEYRPPNGAAGAGGRNAGSPLLLHLDSLDGNHAPKAIFEALRSYLEHEWQRKATDETQDSLPRRWAEGFRAAGKEPPRVVFNPNSLPGLSMATRLPKQNNHTDCGLFLLSYIDFFVAANPDFIATEGSNAQNVHAVGANTKACDPGTLLQKDWFDKRNAAKLRDHLRALICQLMLPRVASEDERRKLVECVVDSYKKQDCTLGVRYLEPVEYLKYIKENPGKVGAVAVDDDVLSNGSDGEEHMEDPKNVLQSPSRHMTRAASKRAGVEPASALPAIGNKRRKVQQPAAEGADPAAQSAGTGKSVVDLSSPDKEPGSSQPAEQQAPAPSSKGVADPESGQAPKSSPKPMEVDGDEEEEQEGEDGEEAVKMVDRMVTDQERGSTAPRSVAPAAGRLKATSPAAAGDVSTDEAIDAALDGFGDDFHMAAASAGARDEAPPAAVGGNDDGNIDEDSPLPRHRRRRRHAWPQIDAGAYRMDARYGDGNEPLGDFCPPSPSSQADPETLPQQRPVTAVAPKAVPDVTPKSVHQEEDAPAGSDYDACDAAAEESGRAKHPPRPSAGKVCRKIKRPIAPPTGGSGSMAADGAHAGLRKDSAAAAGFAGRGRPEDPAAGKGLPGGGGAGHRLCHASQAASEAAEAPVDGLVLGDADIGADGEPLEDRQWPPQNRMYRQHKHFPEEEDAEPTTEMAPIRPEENDGAPFEPMQQDVFTAGDVAAEQPGDIQIGHSEYWVRGGHAGVAGASGAAAEVGLDPRPGPPQLQEAHAGDGRQRDPNDAGMASHSGRGQAQRISVIARAGAGAAHGRACQSTSRLARRSLAAAPPGAPGVPVTAVPRAAARAADSHSFLAAAAPAEPAAVRLPNGLAAAAQEDTTAAAAPPGLAAAAARPPGAPLATPASGHTARGAALPAGNPAPLSSGPVGDRNASIIVAEDDLDDPDLRANLDYPSPKVRAICSNRAKDQRSPGRATAHIAEYLDPGAHAGGAQQPSATEAHHHHRPHHHHHHQQHHHQQHQHHDVHHSQQQVRGSGSRLGAMASEPLHHEPGASAKHAKSSKTQLARGHVQGASPTSTAQRPGASPSISREEHRAPKQRSQGNPAGATFADCYRNAVEDLQPSTQEWRQFIHLPAEAAQGAEGGPGGPPSASRAAAAAAAAAGSRSPVDGGCSAGPAGAAPARAQVHRQCGGTGIAEGQQSVQGAHPRPASGGVNKIKAQKKRVQEEWKASGSLEHPAGVPLPQSPAPDTAQKFRTLPSGHPRSLPAGGTAGAEEPLSRVAGATAETAATAPTAPESPRGTQPLSQSPDHSLQLELHGSAEHTYERDRYQADDGGSVGTDDEAARDQSPVIGGPAGGSGAGAPSLGARCTTEMAPGGGLTASIGRCLPESDDGASFPLLAACGIAAGLVMGCAVSALPVGSGQGRGSAAGTASESPAGVLVQPGDAGRPGTEGQEDLRESDGEHEEEDLPSGDRHDGRNPEQAPGPEREPASASGGLAHVVVPPSVTTESQSRPPTAVAAAPTRRPAATQLVPVGRTQHACSEAGRGTAEAGLASLPSPAARTVACPAAAAVRDTNASGPGSGWQAAAAGTPAARRAVSKEEVIEVLDDEDDDVADNVAGPSCPRTGSATAAGGAQGLPQGQQQKTGAAAQRADHPICARGAAGRPQVDAEEEPSVDLVGPNEHDPIDDSEDSVEIWHESGQDSGRPGRPDSAAKSGAAASGRDAGKQSGRQRKTRARQGGKAVASGRVAKGGQGGRAARVNRGASSTRGVTPSRGGSSAAARGGRQQGRRRAVGSNAQAQGIEPYIQPNFPRRSQAPGAARQGLAQDDPYNLPTDE